MSVSPEFFNVLPPDEALAHLFEYLSHRTPEESVASSDALGRITARRVIADQPLPSFRRSTMDGYALRASDTFGASGALPAFLRIVGEAPMGREAAIPLRTGEAVIVHTGGMIPADADAVAPVEQTQPVGGGAEEIELFRAVSAGQNVLQVGEDVQVGAEILPAGHRLRPQDLGALLALGQMQVAVSGRPRVSILATGDEVVEPHVSPVPGKIRDINSYTIAGQTKQAGGRPLLYGIVPDRLTALQEAAADALDHSDMLVITAGSSVSVRDMSAQVINGLGKPGVLLHGVATRPGKPTIVGVVEGKPVLGLPGNPVSAMVQFDMFGIPAIYRLQGALQAPQRGVVWARLTQNVASESGREDYVPARLASGSEEVQATPVFGKSNLIFTLVNADGLIKIPLNRSGIPAGELVEVRLF